MGHGWEGEDENRDESEVSTCSQSPKVVMKPRKRLTLGLSRLHRRLFRHTNASILGLLHAAALSVPPHPSPCQSCLTLPRSPSLLIPHTPHCHPCPSSSSSVVVVSAVKAS